jgi:hypothetical protein
LVFEKAIALGLPQAQLDAATANLAHARNLAQNSRATGDDQNARRTGTAGAVVKQSKRKKKRHHQKQSADRQEL